MKKLLMLSLACLENFLFRGIWRVDEFAEKLTKEGL